jgi:hypothetical protein
MYAMFWIGQLLAFVAGILGIALAREQISGWLHITDYQLDIALIVLLVVGAVIASREFLRQEAESQSLKQQIETIREYSDVAQLTFNGSPWIGGDIKLNTPLSAIMEGTATEVTPGRFRRVCTDEGLMKYREAIKDFPRFPFSYFWLALCLKDRSDPSWIEYARIAQQIFEHTTQIAGHHPSHDEAKKYLSEILSKNVE